MMLYTLYLFNDFQAYFPSYSNAVVKLQQYCQLHIVKLLIY